jgi:hypothetical protein
MQYVVQALDRRSIGHPNYWRAGRSWPSGQEVTVTVLDQDEDPMITETIKGEARTFPDPVMIGRVSWAKIMADKSLVKVPVGQSADQALELQEKIEAMRQQLAAATLRAELAEKAVLERNDVIEKANKSFQALHDEYVQTGEALDLANARAESAEGAAGRLTIERDELATRLAKAEADVTELLGKPAAAAAPDSQPPAEQPSSPPTTAASTAPTAAAAPTAPAKALGKGGKKG